jgi:beta-glucuronidase
MLYPVLNESRALIDLSGVWKFKTDDLEGTGFSEKWFEKKFENYQTIAVPASYNDQKEDISLRDHYGFVFYQRELNVPKILNGQRIMLRFGAVTHYAKVYLNGELICEHKGGFLPFETDITDIASFGCNLLTVAVDNKIDYSTLPIGNENFGKSGAEFGVTHKPQNYPNFDFFNYAGIIRPVKLYTTPRDYISDISVVPDIIGSNAVVSYKVDTVGSGDVAVEVYNENNVIVARANGKEGTFTIENVSLWQPLNAYLYTAKVTFGDDSYELPFGVRTVEVKGTQFLINGKPFYFKGFGKHEDSSTHGRGIDEVLNVKDISLMKWINANSFRTSHYPYAEEMMNLCDREGIVIIDEVPAVGLNLNFAQSKGPAIVETFKLQRCQDHHRDMITDMISRDKNHACIVMWSIANETDTDAHPDDAYAYYKEFYDLAHGLDPQNRPVTMADAFNDYTRDKTIPSMDVICLNRYYGWYEYPGELDCAQQALKTELDYWGKFGKPVMFTEFGTDTIAGLHLATPAMFSEEYQVEYLKAYFEIFDQYPYFIGEHIWNFADFATSQGLTRVDGNKKGVFTRDRRPKLAAHYVRSRWGNLPDFDYKQGK